VTAEAEAGSWSWGVSAVALRGWLIAAGEIVSGPVVMQRVGNGQSNLVLLALDDNGRGWIIRRPPLGPILESAHDLPREYGILQALRGGGVPVPKVLGLIRDDAVCRAPCIVMERVEGLIVDDEGVASALAPSVRRRVSHEVVDTMVRLHSMDPATVGLGALAGNSSYAERQLRRWTRQWQACHPPRPHPLDGLAGRLHRARPVIEERRIVHGDLHLKNVILTEDGHVRAALDWELCTLGDPIADLGTLLAYWPQAGESESLIFGATRLPGFLTRNEIVTRYVARSGRSVETIAFWYVLALWKLAIIAQGVLRRAQEEPRNRAVGAPKGQEDVDRIAAQALCCATDSGL
jgi:aminoglycoside phosphotransferase (APT) family kinase protein